MFFQFKILSLVKELIKNARERNPKAIVMVEKRARLPVVLDIAPTHEIIRFEVYLPVRDAYHCHCP
jgi:hypothetical protein